MCLEQLELKLFLKLTQAKKLFAVQGYKTGGAALEAGE